MNKTGVILLTEQDFQEYLEGKVSERLKETWDITYEELQEAVQNKKYEMIIKND